MQFEEATHAILPAATAIRIGGVKMTFLNRNSLRLLVSLTLFTVASPALAQTDRTTLEGTVTDSSGAVIGGADIKATAIATGISYERNTNTSGYYRFPGLAVGDYAVEVSRVDFQTKVLLHIVLQVGEIHTLDVQLRVGMLKEKVEVNVADAPIERSSAEASTVIRTDQIANLPVNGRGWAELTLYAPFAQDDGGGDQRTIRFAGRARDDNNFTFDGADATGIQEQAPRSLNRLQISEDAVAEYRVNSALYDVEYGTQAGGQINVVTKSGTNEFHGTVFGYLRNSAFDARNFNDPPVIPSFRLGQYGMTFGGPIVKERSFFFLSYEGLRQLQEVSTAGAVYVPSPSLIKAILVTGRDGLGPSPQMCTILQGFPWRQSTGTVGGCSPKVVFPDSAFQQASLMTGDPSDLPSDFDAFTHNVRTTVHEDTWLVRIDHKLSDKTTLYGRAQRDVSLVYSQIGVTASIDANRPVNHPANYLVALQHAFSENLFNEGKFYVNRSPAHPVIGVSTLPFEVDTNNFAIIPNRLADSEVGTTYGIIDNLTWVRDRHSFKMGIEVRRTRLNQGMTASNTLVFSNDDSLVSASLSGINFIAAWCCHGLRRTLYMPYFQDEWKATPTLAITAGLRWEYYGVAHEATNRTTVFDFDAFHGACRGSGSFNASFPTPIETNPCPRNPPLYNPDYRNFDPRLSLAWAPSALRGRTVFRIGFGIYHGAAQNDDLNAGLESDTFRTSIVPANGSAIPLIPAYEQENPDLSNFPRTQHPRALQRYGRRDLYAEEWGLTIDHQLPAGFLLSASYLGSHGVRLFSRGAVNLCSGPVFVFSNSAGNANCTRPLDRYFPGANPTDPSQTLDPYGSVDIKRDIGSSTYHAMGLALERRFNNGLSFQGRYTWSHSINDGSVGGGESNGPENVNCLPCDKGPSIFDVRHNFTGNAVYELPFGPGKAFFPDGAVKGKIIGGWLLSGTGIWHTGHPLTVNMFLPGSETLLLPDGNDQTFQRPDVIPGVPLTLPGGGRNGVPLINAAAFQSPPVDANGNFTRFGNAGNGVIRALPTWQIDSALTKETKLSERSSLQFAIQAFNVFNHTQLGDPSARLGGNFLIYSPTPANSRLLAAPPGFGVINSTVNFNTNNDNAASPNTGTGLPRQLQFMLRLRF
jgi:hypothetical protein